ncbi:ATP-binding protein [Oceanobacter sp. 4_MG-2023]|uniref:ATP-binding protein n=1 Tax=Oceanobacter sp. 4_MG-2023 TaxID=3062623 RepID=UPI002733355D|nr:ATP-binding protein [Oceanobacter sp. 4_MG-2023]MDP2546389.1 ATP-binding protein [Oceanobacter sp. 4_MG-2023]
MEQPCLFGPNFLEKLVGKSILHDPKVAIVELVANAWDAGASEVVITWPTKENEQLFSIEDNGSGLTEKEFTSRWRTLAYDRIGAQGNVVVVNDKNRTVFGKNGVGRFAGFCFGDSYFVASNKENEHIEYQIMPGSGESPFSLVKQDPVTYVRVKGTKIFARDKSSLRIDEDTVRSEIGMRFLTDPSFTCIVNGLTVNFSHIPEENIARHSLNLSSGDVINIVIIDTSDADKTTKQHGIAWHVNGRLVGEADWKSYGFDEIIDGRSSEAKRHTFIIDVNFLASTDSVKKDWTGFNMTPEFELARNEVFDFVKAHIFGQTKQKRDQVFSNVKKAHGGELEKLTPLRVERWEEFVTEIQRECTNLNEKDLFKLSGVLIKMEQSDTKYSLISKLHELDPSQIDNLHNILADWSLDLAKEVLDELQIRLRLLDELRDRVLDVNTKEVQDLQPLFHQGLWIFGPEFETIEFTSNEGMTKVIQNLFKLDKKGSRNRPDFAILPESTVGSYSYHKYDDDGGEIGIDRLVVVELKKPGIPISTDEKSQCWRYVSELLKKGLISRDTRVTCFVLGSEIDPFERDARKENNDRCTIQPLDYQVVISRAKSRLLKLYDRVKGAPFLEEQRKELEAKDRQNVIEFEKKE